MDIQSNNPRIKFNIVVLIGRLFAGDEEMQILTHSDELNRSYGENTDDPRRERTSPGRTEQDNPSVPESTCTFLQGTPVFKETRATVTVTSAVSSQSARGRGSSEKHGLPEDREGNEGGEEGVEGTSHFCSSPDEVCPAQSPNAGVRGGDPTLTITTWEAGWNVTNAIQVHLFINKHGQKPPPCLRQHFSSSLF